MSTMTADLPPRRQSLAWGLGRALALVCGLRARARRARRFWAASANGWGTQSVTWKPSGGRWAIVVMN